MSNFREVFTSRHTFIAVVHVKDEAQTVRNVDLAQTNGADGVFLINHDVELPELIRIAVKVQERFPSFWLGMNILGMSPANALHKLPENMGGLWTDNAGVQEHGRSVDAETFCLNRSLLRWKGLYFGGIAFKYQNRVQDAARAARLAIPFLDVVTTSGEGTGLAPDRHKIRRMKLAIGQHPIAIASGITPENVSEFMEWSDCFLVATGVSDSHTELNPRRVRKLARMLSS